MGGCRGSDRRNTIHGAPATGIIAPHPPSPSSSPLSPPFQLEDTEKAESEEAEAAGDERARTLLKMNERNRQQNFKQASAGPGAAGETALLCYLSLYARPVVVQPAELQAGVRWGRRSR